MISSRFKILFKNFISSSLSFSTQREIVVRNKKVTLAYRMTQGIILTYIIWYQFIETKHFQAVDHPAATTTTKVKGNGIVNPDSPWKIFYNLKSNQRFMEGGDPKTRIYDTVEYVIPPNEPECIFVMTNFIRTTQNVGTCAESPTITDAICNCDGDCLKVSNFANSWHGIPTGRCIESSKNNTKTCEVLAWCPIENDSSMKQNVIDGTLDYTIFIKNNIEFEWFKKRESNILANFTNKYISGCTNEKNNDSMCPIFSVRKILKVIENDRHEVLNMLEKGAIIEIEIKWNCFYDFFSPKCYPKYDFKRLDAKHNSNNFGSGFSFRFANRFMRNGMDTRTLYKASGIRFFITVSGEARRFDIIRLFLLIGSGIGLLSLSNYIADLVLLKFTQSKDIYKKLKETELRKIKDGMMTTFSFDKVVWIESRI